MWQTCTSQASAELKLMHAHTRAGALLPLMGSHMFPQQQQGNHIPPSLSCTLIKIMLITSASARAPSPLIAAMKDMNVGDSEASKAEN